jgi:hypothetical protein
VPLPTASMCGGTTVASHPANKNWASCIFNPADMPLQRTSAVSFVALGHTDYIGVRALRPNIG